MRILRTSLVLLLTLFAVAGLPATAFAHDAKVTAFVTLDTPAAVAGQQTTITAQLLDAIGGPIADATVRAAVQSPTGTVLVSTTLTAQGDGRYRGVLRYPDAGPAVFRLEAELVDGRWFADTPINIAAPAPTQGASGGTTGMGVELVHEDAIAGRGQPPAPVASRHSWVLPVGAGTAGLVLAALLVARRKRAVAGKVAAARQHRSGGTGRHKQRRS